MPTTEAPIAAADLKSMRLDEIESWMHGMGKERFRALQVYKWLWQRGVRSFDEMTNIAKETRQVLSERARITTLEPAAVLDSQDGTRKFLWRLEDGHHVESVLIPDMNRPGPTGEMGKPRLTLCVSTQVGCAMKCSFCLTGDLGLKRNLTPAEIANQPLQVQQALPEGVSITNIVMMGMGEPLHNYDNLLVALENLLAPDGQGFSHRRITVSTVGIVPRIKDLNRDSMVNIAISLNSTTEEQRLQVMPITKKWSLEELMQTCRDLDLPAGKRITFEYVMMKGFNDSDEDMKRLAQLMRGVKAKVNLIPYNENPDRTIERPSETRVKAFQHYLVTRGINCSIRATRGRDISAACGQLGKAREKLALGA